MCNRKDEDFTEPKEPGIDLTDDEILQIQSFCEDFGKSSDPTKISGYLKTIKSRITTIRNNLDTFLKKKGITGGVKTLNPIITTLNNINVRKSDYDRLQPKTWLNDILIDFQIQIMKNDSRFSNLFNNQNKKLFILNTQIFAYLWRYQSKPAKVCPKIYKNEKLFEYENILLPINVNNTHWILAVLKNIKNYGLTVQNEEQKPKILIYDSLSWDPETTIEILNNFLAERYKYEKGQKENTPNMKALNFLMCKVPQQSNSYDCGLFVLKYLEMILDSQLTFPVDEINWFEVSEIDEKRKEIKETIDSLKNQVTDLEEDDFVAKGASSSSKNGNNGEKSEKKAGTTSPINSANNNNNNNNKDSTTGTNKNNNDSDADVVMGNTNNEKAKEIMINEQNNNNSHDQNQNLNNNLKSDTINNNNDKNDEGDKSATNNNNSNLNKGLAINPLDSATNNVTTTPNLQNCPTKTDQPNL